jgi:tellurite resistance protein TerC
MNGSELIFFIGFLLLVNFLLALDVGVFHKKDHIIGIKEAAVWTVIWISIALLFNGLIFWHGEWVHGVSDTASLKAYYAHYFPGNTTHFYNDTISYAENLKILRNRMGMEYLTGYLMEKSLSIDNIFVMIMIFISFGIEKKYYHRVLFWGIIGAIVLRFIFIFAASALITKFIWTLAVFGVMLLYSGIKMFFEKSEERIDTANHPVVRWAAKFFRVSRELDGHNFFTKKQGKVYITPLFLVLLVIEFSDVIFAVDSIPAVFSITQDPYIVFFSNIFAILGLRSLFFLLDGVMDKFWLLKPGLGVLLTFIGTKMLLDTIFHIEISTMASLFVILGILIVSISASLMFPKKDNAVQ